MLLYFIIVFDLVARCTVPIKDENFLVIHYDLRLPLAYGGPSLFHSIFDNNTTIKNKSTTQKRDVTPVQLQIIIKS